MVQLKLPRYGIGTVPTERIHTNWESGFKMVGTGSNHVATVPVGVNLDPFNEHRTGRRENLDNHQKKKLTYGTVGIPVGT